MKNLLRLSWVAFFVAGACTSPGESSAPEDPECPENNWPVSPREVTIDPWTGTAELTVEAGFVEQPINGEVALITPNTDAADKWTISCSAPKANDSVRLYPNETNDCFVKVVVHCGDPSAADELYMEHELPDTKELVGGYAILGGDDTAEIRAALDEQRISIRASPDGGRMVFAGAGLTDQITGSLYPMTEMPFFDDQVKNDYRDGMSYRDSDMLSNIRFEEGQLRFTWDRVTLSENSWRTDLGFDLPEGWDVWFVNLEPMGPTGVTGTLMGSFDGEALVLNGTCSEPGAVIEVILADGQEQKVRVDQSGNWTMRFASFTKNESGKIVAQLVIGAHQLANEQFSH